MTEPSAADRERFARMVPAHLAAGLSLEHLESGHAIKSMTPGRWLRDAEGRITPGALGVLADDALGTAIMSDLAGGGFGMVTTHLHLEMLEPIPLSARSVSCDARRRFHRGGVGIGECLLSADDGTAVAHATLGALFVRPMGPLVAETPIASDDGFDPNLDFRAALAVEVDPHDPTVTTMSFCSSTQVANAFAGIHGGVGFLIGERALDLALASADETAGFRPVELRAAFLRPVPADGRRSSARATISHRGRRLASVTGQVLDPLGRAAVTVDATYLSADAAEGVDLT